MRVFLKSALAGLSMLLGVTAFAAPGEARSGFYGGGGIVAVRDHGYRDRGNVFLRRNGIIHRDRYYGGGSRYYRHDRFYGDRGFRGRPAYYGRHHYYGGPRYYGRPHYRGNGVVIRLR